MNSRVQEKKKRKEERIVRRDKESRTEEHSEGCKSLERREIKKNGGGGRWVSVESRVRTRENVLRRRMARRRDENLWAVLLESRIQFKRCWSRRDKVARMIDAALLFALSCFVRPSVALNGDGSRGWQTTKRKREYRREQYFKWTVNGKGVQITRMWEESR